MRLFGLDINKEGISWKAGTNALRGDTGGGRAVDVAVSPYEQMTGRVSHVDFDKYISQCVSWVYVCVMKNSTTVARYPLKLYAKKTKNSNQKFIVKHVPTTNEFRKFLEESGHLRKYVINSDEVVEVTEHPFLDLLSKVNPITTRFFLVEKMQMFLELTGNSYWYLVKNGMGLPQQIWNVPSNRVNVLVDPKSQDGNFIAGYTYIRGTNRIDFKRDEIVHFASPSPFSDLYGMGPVAAGQGSILFDNKTRMYENILLDNQCRPDVILSTEQTVTEDGAKQLMGRIRNAYAGKKGLGKWMLLDKGLKASPLNLPLKEMGFIQGRKASKEEIAGLFGVPVSKLTTEDVNLANSQIGEIQYIRDTIAPRLVRIEEKINEDFMPMYDENLFCTYGEVIPNDKTFRLTEVETHLTTQYSSINEERKIDGKEPVEWGDKPIAQQAPANPMGGTPPVPAQGKPNPQRSSSPAAGDQVPPGNELDQLNPAEKNIIKEEIMRRVSQRILDVMEV